MGCLMRWDVHAVTREIRFATVDNLHVLPRPKDGTDYTSAAHWLVQPFRPGWNLHLLNRTVLANESRRDLI